MLTDRQVDLDEPLSPSQLLTGVELVAPASRGAGEFIAGARCGRPLSYPLHTTDLPVALRRRAAHTGARYVGVMFALDLEELPDGYSHRTLRLGVRMDDQRVVAVRVHGGGGEFGLLPGGGPFEAASASAVRAGAAARHRPGWLRRLGSHPGRPGVGTFGAQTPHFGWYWPDDAAGRLVLRTFGSHAVLEVPDGVTELRGRLAVQVDVEPVGRAGGRRRASAREDVGFAEPLGIPEPLTAQNGGAAARGRAAVRLCMAADVSRYSALGNADAERVQRDLLAVLAQARTAAGIDESAVTPQPQGDGQFTVLPIGVDESFVIPRLIYGLAVALTARNAAGPTGDRMRLRVALHRGSMKEGDNGWVGRAAVAVHRILDAPPVRAALHDHPAADFVLSIPDVLYLDVIVGAAGPPGPGDFTAVTVELPAKDFVEKAWLYVAGRETPA